MSVDVQSLTASATERTQPMASVVSIDIKNAGTADLRVNFDESTATDYTLIPAGESLSFDSDFSTLYYATGNNNTTVYLTMVLN